VEKWGPHGSKIKKSVKRKGRRKFSQCKNGGHTVEVRKNRKILVND